MEQQTGKYILIAGILIAIAGLLVFFFHDYFKWIGKLPGDIKIENQRFHFYFPLATMIVLSIVITIIINIINRLF